MRELYPELSQEEFVIVGLSVETNLRANQLVSYADRNGFAWRFAVMSPELLGVVVNHYGSQAIVPPRTPHFVIAPNGALGLLSLGIDRVEELRAELTAAARQVD